MIVYKITNKANNKCYIGITTKTFYKRYNYKKDWWNCRAINRLLKCAVDKYGPENFYVETVDVAEDKEELCLLEKRYIKEFNSMAPTGYNLTDGGENFTPSIDSRLKNRESHLGRKAWNKDIPMSPESKARLSCSLKGKEPWNKGKKMPKRSKETQEKMDKYKRKVVMSTCKKTGNTTIYSSMKEAGMYGFTPSLIGLCCNYPNKYKSHKKHLWQYVFNKKDSI